MSAPAISPLLRDATRAGLGVWAALLGIQTLLGISGFQQSTTFIAGSLLTFTGIMFLFKKMGMVATVIGTISLFMMRLDVGLWAWVWLLWPTAKLYGNHKKAFTFGFWYLIFLHVWRWQHNPDTWWSGTELVLSMLATIPFLAPWCWVALVILMLFIAPSDQDWNIPLIAMHLLTFNMNWVKVKALTNHPVIRIDTKCLYCNKFLDLLIREDRAKVFSFGEAHPNATHMVVEASTGIFVGWNAIVYIFSQLGGFWVWISYILGAVPKPIGENFYAVIASHRYRFFKPDNECRPRSELGSRWVK